MNKTILIISTILILFSSPAIGQTAEGLAIKVLNKIGSCKTISHKSDQKWGHLGDTEMYDPHSGICTFKMVPKDKFVHGYYHVHIKNELIDIYSGDQLSRADLKKKVLTITDLKKFPDTNRITSNMLYTQSALDIYNILLDQKKAKFSKLSFISDTIINKLNCKRLVVALYDTVLKNENFFYKKIISIHPTLHLPLHCKTISKSPYGVQIIETSISDYKLDAPGNDEYFNLFGKHYMGLKKINHEGEEKTKRRPDLQAGQAAPEVYLSKMQGDSVKLSSLRGKVVLLEFSGVHCGFCLVAIKDLKKLYQAFDPDKFSLISVYSDESRETLQKYIDRYQVQYPVLYNGKEEKNKQGLLNSYNVAGIPHFFLINQEGIITWASRGYEENLYEIISSEIKKILN